MSLIQNGANVNAVGEDGRTALIANADLGKNLYLLFRQNFEIVEKKIVRWSTNHGIWTKSILVWPMFFSKKIVMTHF